MSYKDEITQDIAEVMTDLQVQPILFIGSGISQRYFNAPSWKGLMKKLVEMCPELSNKRFAFYEQQFREGNDTDYTQMASSFVEAYSNWAWAWVSRIQATRKSCRRRQSSTRSAEAVPVRLAFGS